MTRPRSPAARLVRSSGPRPVARGCAAALVAASLALGPGIAPAAYFKPRKAFPDGWDAKVEFGAQTTSGASRTSSLSGGADATYRGGRWEHRVVAKALQSTSSVVVEREANGETLRDAEGRPLTYVVRDTTNDRRFLGLEPRWFFRQERNYLFSILDIESNEPAGIERSSRQIAGVGYRLVADKSNWFTAGVGIGRKTLAQTSGERDVDGIGYVGLAFTRLIGERAKFETALDSDFGGENRFTELTIGLTWKLGAPVSLKLGYEARMNSDISDPRNPFDESVDARASISLEIDVL